MSCAADLYVGSFINKICVLSENIYFLVVSDI